MIKKLYWIAVLIVVIDRFFKFFLSTAKVNTGAAFGLLEGWNMFLVLFSLVVIFVILYFRENKKLEWGMGFLLGGTVSNLIDRAVYGGVVDYIRVEVLRNVFNLGDVANVIGAVILIYAFYRK